MAYAHIENVSSTMGSDNPGKGSGKRKRHAFKLKASRYDVPLFHRPKSKRLRRASVALVLNPDREPSLSATPPATTARNNDGMSFVW